MGKTKMLEMMADLKMDDLNLLTAELWGDEASQPIREKIGMKIVGAINAMSNLSFHIGWKKGFLIGSGVGMLGTTAIIIIADQLEKSRQRNVIEKSQIEQAETEE